MKHRRPILAAGLAGLFTLTLAAPAQADLVAHWALDTDGSDAVGTFDGTVGAGISFGAAGANGNTGTAATFTGAGGIQVPWDAALNPTSFTFTAWVNPSSTANWNSVVTSREDNGATVNGFILYNDPDGNWDFWTGAGGPPGAWQRTFGPASTPNEWTHLAITFDEATGEKSLFVNGDVAVAVNQGYSLNEPPDERPFNIGAGQDFGDGFFFSGMIDDAALFNNPLSEAEIEGIMANGVASIPEPSVLAAALGAFSLAAVALLRRRRR